MYGKSLLSYREVDAKANQLSRHLAGLGVTPGSCVGVMMERSLGVCISALRQSVVLQRHVSFKVFKDLDISRCPSIHAFSL